ncbi:hypothetical protein ACJIZ3_010771 [Penstemon smallii]|uniref:Glycosyltransferase n=1 Tax=Penstemon smallii TaxID=265156 RepID=A0ABD3UHA1_9LAMI
MARQFARHKAKTTILLTNLNAAQFSSSIERDKHRHGLDINIRQIEFPTAQVGLPANCESLSSVTTAEMGLKFDKAIWLLQEPVHELLKQDKADCIVADFFIPWTTQVAEKLGIPRLIFHVTGFFPLCVHHSLFKHKPYLGVQSDSEMFTVPELPHVIKMSKRQVPDCITQESDNPTLKIFIAALKTEETSYGIIVNSFRELEPDYVDHYRTKIREKIWHAGPVSLCNKEAEDKAQRVKLPTMALAAQNCLNWLDTQEPNSVVYVAFGTISSFSETQLREIAIGLESSEQKFIWVVRYDDEHNQVSRLPQGFEERIEGKGLVINGWVPQLMILEHESVGGFLTHCGWNSFLEGITAAVPMITWPIFAESLDNEKFITQILKIGVAVGVQEWSERDDVNRVLIGREKIAKAVRDVMIGEEAMEMRKRVRSLSDAAKKAVEVGGSSYNDIESLLQELRLNANDYKR